MAVNKVEINGEVKLDLTQDTVTAAKLAHGETAHDASGELITGTMTAPQLQIAVTTSAGATVTATKGSKTVSGTADASGNCTLTVDETGPWSVLITSGKYSDTVEVVVGTSPLEVYPGPVFDPVFANNDWETIIAACQSGEVPDTWLVGNSKVMSINHDDYQIDIIGKNHDRYADGTGKAPLTFQLHTVYGNPVNTYGMSTSETSVAWTSTLIRSQVLPSIKNLMPAEVSAAIKAVTKEYNKSYYDSSVGTCSDTLFLLSTYEVFGKVESSNVQQGTQYDYYKTAAKRKKTDLSAQAKSWWLRSIGGPTNSSPSKPTYCTVNDEGKSSRAIQYVEYNMYNKIPISFAFCF